MAGPPRANGRKSGRYGGWGDLRKRVWSGEEFLTSMLAFQLAIQGRRRPMQLSGPNSGPIEGHRGWTSSRWSKPAVAGTLLTLRSRCKRTQHTAECRGQRAEGSGQKASQADWVRWSNGWPRRAGPTSSMEVDLNIEIIMEHTQGDTTTAWVGSPVGISGIYTYIPLVWCRTAAHVWK